MRFSSILSIAALVTSVMSAAVPLPGNNVAVKRDEGYGDDGAGFRKRDEGYGDDGAGFRKRDEGYGDDGAGFRKRDEGYSDDAGLQRRE